jgi:hypothetical protein
MPVYVSRISIMYVNNDQSVHEEYVKAYIAGPAEAQSINERLNHSPASLAFDDVRLYSERAHPDSLETISLELSESCALRRIPRVLGWPRERLGMPGLG